MGKQNNSILKRKEKTYIKRMNNILYILIILLLTFNYSLMAKEIIYDKSILIQEIKDMKGSKKNPLFRASDALKEDKEVVLMAIKANGEALYVANKKFWKDRDFVLASVKSDAYATCLMYVDRKFTDDKEIMLLAIKENDFWVEELSERLKNDKVFLQEMVTLNWKAFSTLDKKQQTKALAIVTVKNDYRAFEYMDEKFKNDEEIVLAMVQGRVEAFDLIPKQFRKNKKISLVAVKGFGMNLRYVSKELKKDKEIVLNAVKSDSYAFKYADEELKQNRNFIISIVKQKPSFFQYLSKKFRNDKVVAMLAIRANRKMIKYIGEKLLKDNDIKMLSLKKDKVKQYQYKENILFYKTACDDGFADACTSLGLIYNGLTPANHLKASLYFKKACDEKSAKGCGGLAYMIDNGLGIKKDTKKALQLRIKSCNGGFSDACALLSSFYDEGQNDIKKNNKKAINFAIKACNGNNALGCFRLANIYYKNKNFLKAKKYYKKSCDFGLASGCKNLRILEKK